MFHFKNRVLGEERAFFSLEVVFSPRLERVFTFACKGRKIKQRLERGEKYLEKKQIYTEQGMLERLFYY